MGHINIFVISLWNRLDDVSAWSCDHEKVLFIHSHIIHIFFGRKIDPIWPENALPASR